MMQATKDQIAEWRRKALADELTVEELREAISILRQDRIGAEATSAKSRAKKAPVNSDDLLKELEGF